MPQKGWNFLLQWTPKAENLIWPLRERVPTLTFGSFLPNTGLGSNLLGLENPGKLCTARLLGCKNPLTANI